MMIHLLTQPFRVIVQRKVSSPKLREANRGPNRLRGQQEHSLKGVIGEQEEQKRAMDASRARKRKNEELSETMNCSATNQQVQRRSMKSSAHQLAWMGSPHGKEWRANQMTTNSRKVTAVTVREGAPTTDLGTPAKR